jgi:hypothetical protein
LRFEVPTAFKISMLVFWVVIPSKVICKFNKAFSGSQPRQMYKRNGRFENHLGPHHQRCNIKLLMMRTEMVLETSVSFTHLMRLTAREYFTESYNCGSYR